MLHFSPVTQEFGFQKHLLSDVLRDSHTAILSSATGKVSLLVVESSGHSKLPLDPATQRGVTTDLKETRITQIRSLVLRHCLINPRRACARLQYSLTLGAHAHAHAHYGSSPQRTSISLHLCQRHVCRRFHTCR